MLQKTRRAMQTVRSRGIYITQPAITALGEPKPKGAQVSMGSVAGVSAQEMVHD